MSKSSSSFQLFDPEVEKTAKKLRKEARKRKLAGSKPADKEGSSVPIAPLTDLGSPELREKPKEEPEVETVVEQEDHRSDEPESETESDEAMAEIDPDPRVLPKFYGKAGEDPYNFLNEFTRLCGIQKRPTGVPEETFRMAVFSFALIWEANAWFRRLAPRSVKSWTELKTAFLEYYFPSTKTTALKKAITSIGQEPDESLHGYWARFSRMIEDCPNHKISEGELLQTFYQGITFENKHLMNSSSGGKFSRIRSVKPEISFSA